MALNYTDPNNPSADTSTDTTTSADWFSQNAPPQSGQAPGATFSPGLTGPAHGVIPDNPALSANWQKTTNADGSVTVAPPIGAPAGGNIRDPQYARQLVDWYAKQPGADPSLAANPDYWVQKMVSGEFGDSQDYAVDKILNAWKTPANGAGAVGSYSALTRPDALSTPYTPATFGEKYSVPSVSDLMNDPGYQADAASVQRGLERGAAAKGSLLSGGFIGRTLPTALANFTSTAYKDLNDRNFQAYQSRYNQFLDSNNMALGARQLNENDYNTDVTNNLNQYLTRYGAYQDLIKNNLSYANLGLSATQAGAPTSAGTGA